MEKLPTVAEIDPHDLEPGKWYWAKKNNEDEYIPRKCEGGHGLIRTFAGYHLDDPDQLDIIRQNHRVIILKQTTDE